MGQQLITQNVTKVKDLNCNKTQKLNLCQNLKTQVVIKLNNSNCEEKNQKLKL